MANNKILTAEELLREQSKYWNEIVEHFKRENLGIPDPKRILVDAQDVIDVAIKFAKLHVESALEAASEKAMQMNDWQIESVSKKAIIDSYPLENIK